MDACVIVKWALLDEEYQENALKLQNDHVSGSVNLFAPAILSLEVANVLWKAVKLKRIIEETSNEALKCLGDMNIILHEIDWHQTSQVLNIAHQLDVAIYDAAYLFLSEKLKMKLITSDTKLYEKAKGRFEVLHLKDYF